MNGPRLTSVIMGPVIGSCLLLWRLSVVVIVHSVGTTKRGSIVHAGISGVGDRPD